MAGVGEEEVEYVSDPEEAKISLKMRRREASDDEEEEGEEEEDGIRPRPRRNESRAGIVSDYESEGQGAAADYDDDEESEIEEEEEEIEDEEYDERVREAEAKVATVVVLKEEEVVEFDGDGRRSAVESTEVQGLNEEKKGNEPIDGEYYANNDNNAADGRGGGEEEKKENEPFAVPTAGAFYMHDDRFRDSAGGRHRRTLGGRKLWESKDEKKWGHDKFEEMTMQERHYEAGRRGSRGRYRARGKNRGEDGGYPRANRSKAYNNNNQNNTPKGVRGRGPRRYQPSTMNNSEAPTQNRQPGKSVEKPSYASSGRLSAPASNVELESDPAPSRRNVFASSLSSASPPFYPSGSSNKEISLTKKKDAQSAPIKSVSVPQTGSARGKSVADSIGMDKLYIDDSVSPLTRKPLNNVQLSRSGSSLINSTQSPQSRVQGRGLSPSGQVIYQTSTHHNQVNRVSPPTQAHTVQRAPPVQSRLQPSLQASGQQLGQRPGSGSQVSSPPKTALSVNSFESGETESLSELSKSKTALVGKGKGSVQGSGKGPFPYGGTQVMGGSHGGDQNFPGTPAFLPVMQFGGQHPGGMGVPAVGMAFPGYVAQPQLGLGNSEMTWLPVLAGAAGALGATYCPPYLAVDGAYHARPSGQTSSLSSVSSKENSTNRPSNELKSSQRPELANDEFGQRQNKPRRYTEMKFDQ